MTPKEKAKQLVQRFIDEAYAETAEQLYTPIAKKAALIAVNEIIDILTFTKDINMLYKEDIILYWEELKQEIENL